MLKTTVSVVNTGGNEEHIIGKGFKVLCLANATTTFSINSALAAAAVIEINAESNLLTATAGSPADDGDSPDVLSKIPYFEKGNAGGVAALDANGRLTADSSRVGLAVEDVGTVPNALDVDGVAEEQSPGEAGDLTLDGADVTEGVATFDVPRKVTITSDTDMRGITLSVIGTDENGDALTEDSITGPDADATVTTTGWFATVTQVSVSAAGTNLKVGKAAGLIIIDMADGNVQKITVGAICTVDFINWKDSGIMDALFLRIDNTDNFAITWTGVDLWGAGAVPAFGAADVELLEIFTLDGGTTVEAIIKAADMSAA